MKKNIKFIVIFCVIVVLLAGGLIALKLTAPEEAEEEKTEAEVTTQLLYDKNPRDIEKLTIENEKGVYDIERKGEGDDARWFIADIANLPLSEQTLSSIIENAASLTAQQTVVESAEDLSIYGLDKPSAKVTAAFSDSAGTVKTVLVGNKTPKGTTRYVMVDGDPKVYTAYNTAMEYFLNGKYDIINRTVYTAKAAQSADDTTNYTRVNKMTISRADIDYDIVIEYDTRLDDPNAMVANSSSYVITEPVFRELNPEKCSAVTEGIFGLTASDLGVLNPNEEDMENYGINSPAAEITFEIGGGDVVNIKIGKEFIDEDGKKAGRFVYVDGISIIYIFTEDSLPWLNVMPLDIVTTMFTGNYVYALASVDITGAADLHLTIKGSSADDFEVFLNGEKTDDSAFKDLYQFILRAPSDELYFEETTAEPTVSVDIKTQDGGRDLIEFIPGEGRKSIIRLNGQSVYTCATAYVDRLVKNIELYMNGEEIITSW